MKLSAISTTAAAVGLALASASAQAALAPPTAATGSPTATGLILAIFNTAGTQSDVVNLNYDASAVTLASGNLTPTTAGGAFALAANPTGAAGQVLQVDFGIVPGFSTVAGVAATSNYMVVGGLNGGAGTEEAVVTSVTTPPTAYNAVGNLINNIQSESANWLQTAPNSGSLQDTTGTTSTSPLNGSLTGLRAGQLVTGQQFSGAVGSALGFYDITTTSKHVASDTPYSNGNATDGFFFLASNGDLTYNIGTAGTAPAVPLPPAAWLFGSGLLGMVGIARRRRTQA
jgi:hypothetical protein